MNYSYKNKAFKQPFYFDVKSTSLLKECLAKNIKFLGGKIEEFLNRNVKYVVTDKPRKDWPTKSNLSLSNPDLSDQISNSSVNSIYSVASSTHLINKSEIFHSRGKLLLSKAGAVKSRDVLETALNLGIKIISAEQLFDHTEKIIQQLKGTLKESAFNVPQLHLRSPYIKVEDNRYRFKPSYSELKVWPEIHLDPNGTSSPFVKTKRVSTEVKSLEGLACIKSDPKKLNYQESKQRTAPTKHTTIKRRANWCEICSKEIENIMKHLKSDEHEKYMANEDNYNELKNVVASLPKFNDNESRRNSLESVDENEEDQSCSPLPLTPTLSSTTIQLCGKKKKSFEGTTPSQFVPLHSLVANNPWPTPQETNQQCKEILNDISRTCDIKTNQENQLFSSSGCEASENSSVKNNVASVIEQFLEADECFSNSDETSEEYPIHVIRGSHNRIQ